MISAAEVPAFLPADGDSVTTRPERDPKGLDVDPIRGPEASGIPPIGPGPTPSAPPPAPRRRKKRGCLATGCLTLIGLFVLAVIVVGALLFRVPQQLGIAPSGARLLVGTPDRDGAAAILAQVEKAGVDTTGLSLYVLPVTGQSGTLAYAVLDASAGFTFPTGSAANPLVDLFGRLVNGPAVDKAKVREVAIEYRDPTGHRLGVLTASTDVIRAFIAGQIDEKAFSAKLHGDVDPVAALQAVPGP